MLGTSQWSLAYHHLWWSASWVVTSTFHSGLTDIDKVYLLAAPISSLLELQSKSWVVELELELSAPWELTQSCGSDSAFRKGPLLSKASYKNIILFDTLWNSTWFELSSRLSPSPFSRVSWGVWASPLSTCPGIVKSKKVLNLQNVHGNLQSIKYLLGRLKR